MSRRILGAERQELAKELVKRYTGGESIRALAASTGRSFGFVHQVLRESGVQLRRQGGLVTDEERQDLIRRYGEGESLLALAASTGRSHVTVRRVLTQAGVEIRGPNDGVSPRLRRERARKAGRAAHSSAGITTRLLNAIPSLTEEQVERVRRALPPASND